uniref:ABC transporter permease n=1 Tax=Bosea sp. NBC_00436 TaxID=2969620 RepID=A0A9E8A1P1_9HYPH
MIKYLGSRVGQAMIVLWAAFTASFVLLQALPGDAILIKFMSPDFGLSPQQLADIQASYGSNSPVYLQYLHTLGNFLAGNLGYSIDAGVPVSEIIVSNLPSTLKLALISFAAATLLASSVVVLSTFPRLSWLRSIWRSAPLLFAALPIFWLGIMMIQVFSFRLKLVDVISPGEWEALILPVATLAVPISAPLAQILLRNIDMVWTQPFVAVARAKGASWQWVFWRHVAKNSLIPTLTIAGILFGELLAGAVVTETVFGLQGIGVVTHKAVMAQDTPVLQAVVMLSATIFVLVTLVVDLLYPILDPRLRSSPGA